jgi:hypothetical protein
MDQLAKNLDEGRNPFRGIADRCRLSERTVRTAFSRKPVTWETARKIAQVCGIDMREFAIKADNRGRKKAKSPGV